MNSRRLIAALYVVVLTGLGVAAGALLLDARRQFQQLRQTEAGYRQQLADAEARLKEQERILQRLRTDRDFVEKIIRRRLGYARPGDVIFRFED